MSDIRRIRSRREWRESTPARSARNRDPARRAATVLAFVAIAAALILAFLLL